MRRAHVRRKSEIVAAFARYGFGELFTGIERHGFDAGRRSTTDARSRGVRLRLVLEDLGPTFVKLGQALSVRTDLLPDDITSELERLQDDTPQLDWETVRQVIVDELGEEPDTIFASIEQRPLASASIGQTHAGVLEDRPVVIKVQRPGIERQMRTDLAVLHDFARVAQRTTKLGSSLDLVEAVDDFASALVLELDYRRELRNTERFAGLFARTATLRAPEVFPAVSTEHVLVIERFEGSKVSDLDRIDAAGADKEKLAGALAHLGLMAIQGDGWFHADPHPGNLFVLDPDTIGVIDYGRVAQMPRREQMGLGRAIFAWSQGDVVGIADALEALAVWIGRIDRNALERDIAKMLAKFGDASLGELDLGSVLHDFVSIAQAHAMRLPSDLVLYGNALAMVETSARRLDPSVDVMALFRREGERARASLLSPQNVREMALADAIAWGELAHELPRRSRSILRQVESGTLRIEVKIDAQEPVRELQRSALVVATAIIAAAMVIGLALIASTGIVRSGFARAVGLIAFVLVAIELVALAGYMWHTRRRRPPG